MEYSLSNYPNPFNPTTVIGYQLPVTGHVTLRVLDMLGREIVTLVNEEKQAGKYEVKFDGGGLASGIYFYQLITSKTTRTMKLVLQK
ncbi:MAG: T9SS type A sorting domain-containing protein [Bacteroidetes bacterium]|nr:T9SS type A sorting domain-containing protein [Bacteroidota bacterium]